eukprot:COSAG03_NODE_1221_length_4528_cov_6.191240_2_plen_52_part_00
MEHCLAGQCGHINKLRRLIDQLSRSQLWAAGAAGAEGEALVEDGVGVATPE